MDYSNGDQLQVEFLDPAALEEEEDLKDAAQLAEDASAVLGVQRDINRLLEEQGSGLLNASNANKEAADNVEEANREVTKALKISIKNRKCKCILIAILVVIFLAIAGGVFYWVCHDLMSGGCFK